MKMGSATAVIAMAIALMIGALLHGAEAQSAFCGDTEPAPWADATTVVNQLRLDTGQCCNTGDCTVVATSGNAAATVCGPIDWCPNCSDVGNGLNEVLAQCNVANVVCGSYWPDDNGTPYFYLSNASNPP